MTRRLGALIALVVLAGCSGATTPAPASPATSATSLTATPRVTPAPTTNPTVASTEGGEMPSGRIVFGRQTPGWDGWKVLVIDADGTDERQLFDEPHDVTRVSHDGTRIATVSFDDKGVFVQIFDAAGRDPIDVRPDKTLNLGAMAWSRDDEWLAFEAWDDTDHSRDGIWIVRVDGSELRRLTDPGIPGDFSPDDSELVFVRDGVGTFVIDVDGKDERQIEALGSGPYPGYLPDGSIYAATRGAMWIVDPATGEARPIELGSGRPIEPRLSPDGRTFAFSFIPNDEDSIGIWTMSVDGSNLRRVVNTEGTEEVFPDWLP